MGHELKQHLSDSEYECKPFQESFRIDIVKKNSEISTNMGAELWTSANDDSGASFNTDDEQPFTTGILATTGNRTAFSRATAHQAASNMLSVSALDTGGAIDRVADNGDGAFTTASTTSSSI